MTSHEGHGIANHRHLDLLFNSLFRLTTERISKLHITGLLWGEFIVDRWIPLTKRQWWGNVSKPWRYDDGSTSSGGYVLDIWNPSENSRYQWFNCTWKIFETFHSTLFGACIYFRYWTNESLGNRKYFRNSVPWYIEIEGNGHIKGENNVPNLRACDLAIHLDSWKDRWFQLTQNRTAGLLFIENNVLLTCTYRIC